MRKHLIVADDQRARDLGLVRDSILRALISTGAPRIQPKDIAPHLVLSVETVRFYCRKTKSLRAWQGQYTFQMDDPEHVEALTDVIWLALWSMKSAPKHRKPVAH